MRRGGARSDRVRRADAAGLGEPGTVRLPRDVPVGGLAAPRRLGVAVDSPPEQPVDAGGHALRFPFVGRHREAGLVRGSPAWQAMAGRGSVLIFEGEQGCGKTRLLDRLGDSSQDAGVLLLEGRAFDADGTPPFWIWRAPLAPAQTRATSARAVVPLAGPSATAEVAAIRDGHRSPASSPARPARRVRRPRHGSSSTPRRCGRSWCSSTTCTGPTWPRSGSSPTSAATSPAAASSWSAPGARRSARPGRRRPARHDHAERYHDEGGPRPAQPRRGVRHAP